MSEGLEPAYVLHGRDFRESSRIVELFAAGHGRVGVVARGARGPRSPWRSLLQPFRPLLASWGGRGELATLRRAEPAGAAPLLRGEALLAGLYANELLLRLTVRGDPHPGLFAAYHALLGALPDAGRRRWALRRFEAALLEELGWGLPLERTADGAPVVAEGRYRLEGGQRLVAVAPEAAGAVSGATLLALRGEEPPPGAHAGEARRLLQQALARHLGGRPLRSPELLGGRRGAPAGEAEA
ncbi:DNA repair protein RecO [Inmirania thermothiophila]|uniref:DNA repair protein RecO n=1 Tax=Inmirania thermothiophila TaxID=1750597 RepID=A0A3N1XZW6_9GAMM|nr:DNA repair protein RecO [Inmirania thermothiophila]ROR32133.1 DNA replication and repair protein RecO [Inmirania thermothiophila]